MIRQRLTAACVFRMLILFSWGVPILSFFLLQIPYSKTPLGLESDQKTAALFDQIHSELQIRRWPDWAMWYAGAVVLLLALVVVVPVGLWYFKWWARALYFPLAIMYVYVLPFGTPYTPAGIGRAAEFLGFAIEGIIVAMAFLPPIAGLFETPRQIGELGSGKEA